jgi:hypothetical protein
MIRSNKHKILIVIEENYSNMFGGSDQMHAAAANIGLINHKFLPNRNSTRVGQI